MVDIPQSVFDIYNDTVDDMINQNFGINCKIIYPPTRVQCNNCVFDSIGRKSANRYAHGGPAPFNFGVCPTCGGAGYREQESEDTIKMRVYYTPKEFIKIANLVNIPDGAVMVIGFLTDSLKIKNSYRIIINSDLEGLASGVYEKLEEPVPWGFKKNRYFRCVLKRAA